MRQPQYTSETAENNFKTALELCQVIDKKNVGLIPKANFDKIVRMSGFLDGDLTSEHEQMFSELLGKFTV
jgi:3-deoxy-D-manno-octulosonic acid (KDO) 8-phosphate synthase